MSADARTAPEATVGRADWRDYDQAELDAQYEQRTLVPDAAAYFERHLRLGEEVCARLDCRLDVAYGPGPDERLDVFPAGGTDTPVVVYLHGGAWTRWTKAHNRFQAPAFVDRGVAFVSVEFTLVPPGTLDQQVAQCRAAFAWVHAHAREFGGDPAKLYVAGHSSGGHMAAMLATTDWAGDAGLPADAVKGTIAASGIYDLAPVRASARNGYLQLDAEGALRNSPMAHIPDALAPTVIAYGTGELAEFQRQSRDFAAELGRRGHDCREVVLPGLNHFEVGEAFAEPDGPLLAAAFEMIGV